jgi:chemotaxis protein methyltransferase CheR
VNLNLTASSCDLERFRAAIIHRMGLQFDDAKLAMLGEVMQRRLHKLGQPGEVYLRNLEGQQAGEELSALARELTVGETYFFRNIEQFRALAEIVLPARMKARRASATMRLLSAGCASGEEPYTMAIVAKETIAEPFWKVAIRAVDINPAALQKAERAHYSTWVLRETPLPVQQKYFSADGRDMLLDMSIRDAVGFSEANLAEDDGELWPSGHYDVIFCRNVLMYFSPEQMRAAIERIAQSLAPGGFLFLGHAETLRGVSDCFHLHHSHGTFYYSLKGSGDIRARPFVQIALPTFSTHAPPVALDQAWYDAIGKASERVAALVPDKANGNAFVVPPPLAWNVAPAFDLLRQERFIDALHHVRTRPSAAGQDPDVLLLEAALLAHSGALAAAEDGCLRLLLVDEFNDGAHYVLALCREHAGRIERAIEHDRVASYLDPEFAMPRLHLGLLAGRAGDRECARRELAQALELLKRENASRLLLFGGGFNREALMTLCRSALKENGGEP